MPENTETPTSFSISLVFSFLAAPPLDTTQNMFAVHGDLAHVKVVYDRSTGKSMGYGFVKFTTDEAAAAATAAINGMAIERKRIKVRRTAGQEGDDGG